MSSIPENIIGSIFQANVSSADKAKTDEAQRNKQARDARKMARLAEQQETEVEDTEQTDHVRVNREDERQRNGQDARDTYEAHEQNNPAKLYHLDGTGEPEPSEDVPPTDHIDFSA
jgi:hypothetical protein